MKEFCIPTHLLYGAGCASKIAEYLAKRGQSKPLIVTDKGLVNAGVVAPLVSALEAGGAKPVVFDEVRENPPEAVVLAAFKLARDSGCDSLVGLGGGSSMDAAKLVGALMTNPGPLAKYEGPEKLDAPPKKIIAVPTTAGTGSEVTGTAVVTFPEKRYKASIRAASMVPDAAFLDPVLMEGLPFSVAASTGLDALSHAVEAFTTTLANPVTDGLAIQAMRLIAKSLRPFCGNRKNHAAGLDMLIASNLAGQSFTWARVGAAHAMSIPLGGQFNIPHGVATAIVLPHVMRFNLVACPEKYAEMARMLGEDTSGLTVMEAAALSVQAVEDLMDDLEVPTHLCEVGAKEDEMAEVVEKSIKSGIASFNPRTVSKKDFERLFEASM